MVACTNCGGQSPALWKDGQASVAGMAINRAMVGYYDGFMDSFGHDDEWAFICHDCSLLLMRTMSGLAKFLLPDRGGHPVSGEEPCCEFAWKHGGFRGTSEGTWENYPTEVGIEPNNPYSELMSKSEISEPTWEQILDEEYYSIGVNGAQAIVNMLDDYNSGKMDGFLEEAEMNGAEFLAVVNRLAVRFASNNLLNVTIGER